jgi:hypothetical protein
MVLGTGMALPTTSANAAVPGLNAALPTGTRDEAMLDKLRGKNNLINLLWPPNYEAPVAAFHTPITAKASFFVRYDLADIPEMKELSERFPESISLAALPATDRPPP